MGYFYDFFFADVWRPIIMILIIIAIILFLLVFGKTLFTPRKFKLIYIVMLNLVISAILNSVGFLLNWVKKDKKLLFGDEKGFFCKAQSIMLLFFHTARENFCTLVPIVSFISFKYGDNFDIDNNKLCLILVFLVGYLIPLIENIIYYFLGVHGQSDYYCLIKKEGSIYSALCGNIHLYYVIFLVIISFSLTIYLVIKTGNCNKNSTDDVWLNDNEKKTYCIHPMLKKIMFFPIVQVSFNVVILTYRVINNIYNYEGVDFLAEPAATLGSTSSILFTLIFAITNEIFTKSERESITESETESEIEDDAEIFELERKNK